MNAKIYTGNVQPNHKEFKIWVNDEGLIKTWNGQKWSEVTSGGGGDDMIKYYELQDWITQGDTLLQNSRRYITSNKYLFDNSYKFGTETSVNSMDFDDMYALTNARIRAITFTPLHLQTKHDGNTAIEIYTNFEDVLQLTIEKNNLNASPNDLIKRRITAEEYWDTTVPKQPVQQKGFVDLGLPSGLLWSTCNLGAEKPEDFGLYFAWGETTGYTAEDVENGLTSFSLEDYDFFDAATGTLTKYVTSDAAGTIDNLTTLELVDDAAYQADNTCRIPALADFEELVRNTFCVYEKLNGVLGTRLVSKINGNSIFVPATGLWEKNKFKNGKYCVLWINGLHEKEPSEGNCYRLVSEMLQASFRQESRWCGLQIRPVKDSK